MRAPSLPVRKTSGMWAFDVGNDHHDRQDLSRGEEDYQTTRVVAVVLVAVGVALVTIWLGHRFDPPFSWPARDDALALAGRIFEAANGAGIVGIAGVIAAYALGVLMAVPSTLMMLAVTLIYGLWAIPIVFAGAFLGLALAFDIARTTLREDFNLFWHRHIPGTPGIARLLAAHGGWVTFLMRLSPVIPFSGQNYMFGTLLTPARAYLIGSALGIIPVIIARVLVFDFTAGNVDQIMGMTDRLQLAIGLVASAVIIVLVYRAVRADLRQRAAANHPG